MTSAVLHIGAGKCGSSAIQSGLSRNPLLISRHGGKIEYVALQAGGELLHGEDLTNASSRNASGYTRSCGAKHLSNWSRESLSNLKRKMEKVAGNKGRLVLSSESWINEPAIFQELNLLQRLGLSCEVVAYVRPPVEWINSAWWQWGAWTGADFPVWFGRQFEKVCWHEMLAPWRNVDGVSNIHVRLLPSDVVADFCSVIDAIPFETNRSNTSLSAPILRLFQRHPRLRPEVHNAEIDFVLSQQLEDVRGKPPWILNPTRVERILERTKDCNYRLLDYLDDKSRIALENDPRWWSVDAYENRETENPMRRPIDVAALDALAAEALSAVHRLGVENLKLADQIRRLRDKLAKQ